jgi:hypothetical protein
MEWYKPLQWQQHWALKASSLTHNIVQTRIITEINNVFTFYISSCTWQTKNKLTPMPYTVSSGSFCRRESVRFLHFNDLRVRNHSRRRMVYKGRLLTKCVQTQKIIYLWKIVFLIQTPTQWIGSGDVRVGWVGYMHCCSTQWKWSKKVTRNLFTSGRPVFLPPNSRRDSQN